MENIQIFIPSLNPDGKLLWVVNSLLESTKFDIIVLDDGSDAQHRPIFDEIACKPRCTVLRHHVNLGKGRALKDGFNYILNTYPDSIGTITVDGDGQHTTKDIVACANALYENPESLVLGSRDFDQSNVPAKSELGNKITRRTMKLLCGIDIPDTQTGLRGISREFMKILMNTAGERFEFETNMLMVAKEYSVPFKIVLIDTVYIDDNTTSHFNPIRDSIKIYSIFAKFLFSSISSSLIDIIAFTAFVSVLRGLTPAYYIYIATALARIISSIYNFNVNKHTVFRNKDKNKWILVKYFVLCVVQASLSALCVKGIFSLLSTSLKILLSESVIKIIVDTILFFVSFGIQRDWVFGKGKNKQNNKIQKG